MINAMAKLAYWSDKRNQLIHSAKGVSKARMKQEQNKDLQLYQNGQMKNKNIKRHVSDSCSHKGICQQLNTIAEAALMLMGKSKPSSLTYLAEDYLKPDTQSYYLYSDIRDYVIKTLNQDLEMAYPPVT